jgi:hypothetical protein
VAVVATNTALKSKQVGGHAIVPLGNGRRLAVLSVTDHSHLPSDSVYKDGTRNSNVDRAESGERLQVAETLAATSFRQAVSAELHKLSQLEGGSPEVVVCIITGIDMHRDVPESARASSSADGAHDGRLARDEILQFAREMIGVDIFIVAGVRGLATPSQYVSYIASACCVCGVLCVVYVGGVVRLLPCCVRRCRFFLVVSF